MPLDALRFARQGPNLLDTSSELIHQGDVSKLTSSSWSKELCTLFLFDHVLIYCRRDLLKRSVQQFRGRINLDTAQVVDLTDGKGERVDLTDGKGESGRSRRGER